MKIYFTVVLLKRNDYKVKLKNRLNGLIYVWRQFHLISIDIKLSQRKSSSLVL